MAPLPPPPPIPTPVQVTTPIVTSNDHHQYHSSYNHHQQQQQQQQQQYHHHHQQRQSSSRSGENSNSRVNVAQYSSNFWENYEHLCALQNSMPLQSLKACLATDGGANLVLNADKLK